MFTVIFYIVRSLFCKYSKTPLDGTVRSKPFTVKFTVIQQRPKKTLY